MRIEGLGLVVLLLAATAVACDDRDDREGGSSGFHHGGDQGDKGGNGNSAGNGDSAGEGNAAGAGAQDNEGGGGSSELEGRCQKGPFVRGSTVNIQLLDEELGPQGVQFTVQTENDLGEFRLRSSLGSHPLELFATGFFFNELSGQSSDAPITLRAITPSKDDGVNVNVLTHLQSSRVVALVRAGSTLEAAFAASHVEVLDIFGIPAQSIPAFGSMDLLQGGDGNASLLAVSALLTQAATARGGSLEAALTELLSEISDDLSDDGEMDAADVQEELRRATGQLAYGSVRAYLDRWLEDHSLPSAPDFEKWLDLDGDGLIGNDDEDSDNDGLADADDPNRYVPESPWIEGTTLLMPRRSFAACSLGEKIFVFGGLQDAWLTSAEVYDAVERQWNAIAALPVAIAGPTCRAIDGQIYVFGMNGTVAYDPSENSYEVKATMPAPRGGFSVAVADGVAYVIGGASRDYDADIDVYSDAVDAYVPATNQWSARAPLPKALANVAVQGLDGKVYAFGGNDDANKPDKSYVYDVSANEWSPIAPQPEPTFGGTTAVLDGLIYVFGGVRADLGDNLVQRYDPATNEWLAREARRDAPSYAALAFDGSIYLVGTKVWIYRPQFDL